MKKILLIALAVVMAVSIFASCAKPEEKPAEPVATTFGDEEDTPAQPTQEEQAPEQTPEPAPENISPTTGLENTTTTYKPVWVQIDNESGGRPQVNIQVADIVYETLIEDTATRLSALYNDVLYSDGAPDKLTVGPVRSSRYYHQNIVSEWDALYIHMGGPDKTNNPESDIWGESNKRIKQRINGAGKGAVAADKFYALRSGQSISNYAAVDVIDASKTFKYEPTPRAPFKYYPLESYADAPAVDTVQLQFLSKLGFVEYKYDEAKNKLIRYMSGKEFTDGETGKPIEVQNLIIQFVGVGNMPNDAPRRKVDVFGQGPAAFIINGKHLKGTWQRASAAEKTTYLLENGDEVTLAPGNTWIAMHPNDKTVEVTYKDGKKDTVNA